MHVRLKNNVLVNLDRSQARARAAGLPSIGRSRRRGKGCRWLMLSHFVDCPKAKEFKGKSKCPSRPLLKK